MKLRHLLLLAAVLLASVTYAQAQVQSPTGLTVSLPNGFATLEKNDLIVKTAAGDVRWVREWDGREWKFNAQWESLSSSFKNLTGSESSDTPPSTPVGCSVLVDEDWEPTLTGTVTIDGIASNPPLVAARSTPFNSFMGDPALADYTPPVIVNIDYATLCLGATTGAPADLDAVRRINELYLGNDGRYAFNNRAGLVKSAIRELPAAPSASLDPQLASGRLSLAPVANPKGYRWTDRDGTVMDYNTQGQFVAWSDKNGNTIWLQRDSTGRLRGAIDGSSGQVLFSLHYTGDLLTEVRDYPNSALANGQDLPARRIQYQYDAGNRLSAVIDPLGYTTRYGYSPQHRLTQITDAEGRIEKLSYNDETVAQRIAPDGGITDYLFDYDDANKQFSSTITGPVTPAGRRIDSYTHNRIGKLVRQVVNGRIETEVKYDSGARAEISTNARGFVTRTVKDEFDQVTDITYPDGSSVKRRYSPIHIGVLDDTDEAGILTRYDYDTQGNLIRETQAVGTAQERSTEIERNAQGQITRRTRKGKTEANGTVTPDATWQLEYDASGQIRQTTDPEGNLRQYQYTRSGQLAQVTDPLGNTTRYTLDANGRLTQVTDPLGRVQTYAYDKVGNLTRATDARGKAIQLAYDALNRATQLTNAVGASSKRQYNPQGQPTRLTDADGRVRQLEFDSYQRLASLTDALGNRTGYGYQIEDGSSGGQLGSLTGPTDVSYPSFTQQTKYDERERPTSQTLKSSNKLGPETLTRALAYDKRSLLTSDTDAYGKSQGYRYDALGQLIETTDRLGGKTSLAYDSRGNLIALTDAKGSTTKFDYDRNDRVVKETRPLGQVTSYQYDAAGNLVGRIDPLGRKTTYTRDAARRITEIKQFDAANALQRTTSYTWDAADNLSAWSETDSSRSQTTSAALTYDDANRKLGETVTYPNGTTLNYGYGYSPAGYKTQLTWPDGTLIGYSYSTHGELELVTIPGEGTISVNQFKWTAPAQLTLPGGTTQARTYDGLLKLEALKVTASATTVLDLANTYGKNQELTTRNRTDSSLSLSSTQSSSFSYDDETRLTQAQRNGDTESFTLDAVANRVAYSQAGNPASGAWRYDANHRLLQMGEGAAAISFEYDAAGNRVRKTEPGNKVTSYAYDGQNRLIEVKVGADSVARYGYDPLNRRLWKEQYRDKDGSPLTPARRTYFLYADEGLIAEATQDIVLNADGSTSAADGSPGTMRVTTQYGPRPDSPFTTGTLFVKTKDSNGDDSVAYFHHDHLNTPIQATDKMGRLVWAATYEAFGKATIITPQPTADQPSISSNLRLPGQYEDPETGLHYNWHRYYDPTGGGYVTEDPIGLDGGVNRYTYVEGNPITGIDTFGLANTGWQPSPRLANLVKPKPSGLVQICHRPVNVSWLPDFVSPYLPHHHWVKTPAGEGGMGAACAVPGQQCSDKPYSDTHVKDHGRQSGESGAQCQSVGNDVDVECVQRLVTVGRETGTWSATNNCTTFAYDVVMECRRRK